MDDKETVNEGLLPEEPVGFIPETVEPVEGAEGEVKAEEAKTNMNMKEAEADMKKQGLAAVKDPKKAMENGKGKLADFLDDGKINNSNTEGLSLGQIAKNKIMDLADDGKINNSVKVKPDPEDPNAPPIEVDPEAKPKSKGAIQKAMDKFADYLDDGKMNNSAKDKNAGEIIGNAA